MQPNFKLVDNNKKLVDDGFEIISHDKFTLDTQVHPKTVPNLNLNTLNLTLALALALPDPVPDSDSDPDPDLNPKNQTHTDRRRAWGPSGPSGRLSQHRRHRALLQGAEHAVHDVDLEGRAAAAPPSNPSPRPNPNPNPQSLTSKVRNKATGEIHDELQYEQVELDS